MCITVLNTNKTTLSTCNHLSSYKSGIPWLLSWRCSEFFEVQEMPLQLSSPNLMSASCSSVAYRVHHTSLLYPRMCILFIHQQCVIFKCWFCCLDKLYVTNSYVSSPACTVYITPRGPWVSPARRGGRLQFWKLQQGCRSTLIQSPPPQTLWALLALRDACLVLWDHPMQYIICT